jgi:rhodanese-related sulfurtransferase
MKPLYRRALTEATIIVLAATVLGFVYTGIAQKGLFSASPSASATTTLESTLLTYEEARDLFLKGDALFVDARHTYDFGSGHIKGAISIPLQDFNEIHPLLTIIPKDKMLVTYCDGEECNSSRELALKLKSAGFFNVRVFFGGWTTWLANGQPKEP